MTPVGVVASGMVTGLGFNAAATLAALRAGVSAIRQTPWVDFASGEPLRGARVSLPQWWEGPGKLVELVAPAISECLAAASEPLEAIPLLIGMAEPSRPGRTPQLEERLLEEIEFRLGLPAHRESRIFAGGQVGCAQALMKASSLFDDGRANLCVVAGVDSFLQQTTLDAYMERRRLMTASNSNGFFPGEAGCAVLVCRPGTTTRDELRVIGFGMAQEAATIESTRPLRAVGLTNALKQAIATSGVSLNHVAFRVTDLSGEHYKFKEAMLAANRLNRGRRQTQLDLWHPSEYLGEIGAAIVPCLLGWTLHAQQHGYANGPLALCHAGSDDGQRVAMILRYETVPRAGA